MLIPLLRSFELKIRFTLKPSLRNFYLITIEFSIREILRFPKGIRPVAPRFSGIGKFILLDGKTEDCTIYSEKLITDNIACPSGKLSGRSTELTLRGMKRMRKNTRRYCSRERILLDRSPQFPLLPGFLFQKGTFVAET